MAKPTELFERAKARIEECKEFNRPQHERIRGELRFSNPANPEQWAREDLTQRSGRASLTLDRTNQFIQQVVNDARQSNPGVQVLPVDDKGDPKTAEVLGGMFRHIEYRSRAPQAYDTAIDLSARVGLGWLRCYPEDTDVEGEQEIRIARIVDSTSAGLDPNSVEADGSDARWSYVETAMTERAFKAAYPKAKPVTFSDAGWRAGEKITICEYFEIEEQVENTIVAIGEDGYRCTYSEDDYWRAVQDGEQLRVIETSQGTRRRVRWVKMTGAEVLEETEFPSRYQPIIPVLGYELWVDGQRYLCGLTRRLMDGQKLHNYQMSAVAEFLGTQPKAPIMAPFEAIEGFEDDWARLNRGNPAYLPYNALDENGRPIPAPTRQMPPPMPGAYAQMAQFAVAEMEASVGMYKANLGQQGNETSGRAIRARQLEGDTATFHFIDNLSRSIEQLARVIIDMIPRIYTRERVAHIVGADGGHSTVRVTQGGPAARVDQRGKVLSINPNVGRYDVRVKTGPSYTTQREDTAQQLADMIQAQPQLAPILGPMWARLKDIPEGDKISRLLLAMAPPQVQQLEGADEGQQVPPEVAARLQQQEQQLQEMHQMLEQAAAKLQELQAGAKAKELDHIAKAAELEIREYEAETKRLQVMGAGMTPEQVQAIASQVVMQAMRREPLDEGNEMERAAGVSEPPESFAPEMLPDQEQPEPQQPPQGGFFTPEPPEAQA